MMGRIEAVSALLERVIRATGRDVLLRDRASGQLRQLSPDAAVAPDGLLPVFLAAGEAVWREARGVGFGLGLDADDGALLGYRAARLGGMPLPVILLATMEAIEQVARPGVLIANDLNAVCRATTPTQAANAAPGPSP